MEPQTTLGSRWVRVAHHGSSATLVGILYRISLYPDGKRMKTILALFVLVNLAGLCLSGDDVAIVQRNANQPNLPKKDGDAYFNPMLTSNILMFGVSGAFIILICLCVTSRFLTHADPLGIIKGGCGLAFMGFNDEWTVCCTIS